jgi:hypothetical protein
VKARQNGTPAGSPSQVETLEHIAALMLHEERPAWAFLVSAAAETLAGRGRPLSKSELLILVDMLDLVAETMLAHDRPAWASQAAAASDTLRARLGARPKGR